MDDPFVDVIRATVDVLDDAVIKYAITGSVASSVHGEPVTSQDVDILVWMTMAQARHVAVSLPKRFYRSAERLQDVACNGGMANLVDSDTGLKVDLCVLGPGAFHESVLARRSLTAFGPDGPSFYTVSPEDIILMKLDWRRDTKSQKQWDNALSVVRVQGVSLDWRYLFEQAESLSLTEDLIALRDEAGV